MDVQWMILSIKEALLCTMRQTRLAAMYDSNKHWIEHFRSDRIQFVLQVWFRKQNENRCCFYLFCSVVQTPSNLKVFNEKHWYECNRLHFAWQGVNVSREATQLHHHEHFQLMERIANTRLFRIVYNSVSKPRRNKPKCFIHYFPFCLSTNEI